MIRKVVKSIIRDGFRSAATCKMESFVIIVNCWKPLTIITKCSILDVAAALDLPLIVYLNICSVMPLKKYEKAMLYWNHFILSSACHHKCLKTAANQEQDCCLINQEKLSVSVELPQTFSRSITCNKMWYKIYIEYEDA